MSDIPDVTVIKEAPKGLVEKRPDSSSLVIIYGEYLGRRFAIENNVITIGRSPQCTIHLSDDSVSRKHCEIKPGRENAVIADLESTNGTFVNGATVAARPLRDGDTVQVGRSIFKFLSGDNIEQAYHEEIYRLKTTDGLTGANNKRAFEEEIKRELYRFLRYKRPLTLIMMDIDHFKKVNDTYGHLAGDRVLSELGKIIGRTVRREDTFCRYGGEEFAMLMPETEMIIGVERAENIRHEIEGTTFTFDGSDIPITMSFGVATAGSNMEDPSDFVSVADKRLYEAKSGGRNQVVPDQV